MTTFRFDAAKAIVADVIVEWTDLPGELDTITGYTLEEYRRLEQRLQQDVEPSAQDRHMLRQVAAQFGSYPGMSTHHCEKVLGDGWFEIVRGFVDR